MSFLSTSEAVIVEESSCSISTTLYDMGSRGEMLNEWRRATSPI